LIAGSNGSVVVVVVVVVLTRTCAVQVGLGSTGLVTLARDLQINPNEETKAKFAQAVREGLQSVQQLAHASDAASADIVKGIRELDRQKKDIEAALAGVDATPNAQAEDVVRAARRIVRSNNDLVRRRRAPRGNRRRHAHGAMRRLLAGA
jgi:ABC-type nitrate/sulfonate/bicarbonate transport system substrate-binding protein